jgi:hypothetical protein
VELHLVQRLNLKLNKLPNFKAISNDDLPISVAAIEKEIKIEEVIFDWFNVSTKKTYDSNILSIPYLIPRLMWYELNL